MVGPQVAALTQEYEKRGGGYEGEKDQSRKPREVDRGGVADQRGRRRGPRGRGDQALPAKKAWENMSEEEREETEQKKREGSKKGQQYVSKYAGSEAGPQGRRRFAPRGLRRPERGGREEEGERPFEGRHTRPPRL